MLKVEIGQKGLNNNEHFTNTLNRTDNTGYSVSGGFCLVSEYPHHKTGTGEIEERGSRR
jgi:hypothetical protein